MFLAYAKDGKITMGAAVRKVFQEWLVEIDGQQIQIELFKRTVSEGQRGYLFGAVIPLLKRLVPAWAALDNDQVYEILKKNFNSFEAFNPLTQRIERYGQSVMAAGNDAETASAFIQEIGEWVQENYGRPLPDPEKYKRWKDSGPLKGEVYNDDDV